MVAELPPGTQTICFVNPNDPSEAVIQRGWVPEMWWGLLPIPFLLFGIGLLLVAIGVIPMTSRKQVDLPSKRESFDDSQLREWSFRAMAVIMGEPQFPISLGRDGLLAVFLVMKSTISMRRPP